MYQEWYGFFKNRLNMKNFVSYKGRSLNFGDYVEVYRNLRNHKFSVRVNGLVVGYVDEIKLENVLTKVGKSGRERVLLEKQKNVHAFICGTVVEEINIEDQTLDQLYYNPFEVDRWVMKSHRNIAVSSTNYVLMRYGQVFMVT